MCILASNRDVFRGYIKQRGLYALLEGDPRCLEELSQRITPESIKPRLARRFSRIIKEHTLKQLLIDETRRIFNRFLKEWTVKMTEYALQERGSLLVPELRLEPSIVQMEFADTLVHAREAEKTSKRVAFIPTLSRNPLVFVEDKDKVTGVFKIISGQQMAGELFSYFFSLFCGVDFFHSVLPGYCWVNQEGVNTRKMGIFSCFHEGKTVHELFKSADSNVFEPLYRLQKEYVQGICLMHMLRGSEDAHMGNTMIQTTRDPREQEEIVSKIIEIDGEHVMSASERKNDRFESPFESRKDIANLRIWWLGLPQAAEPLSNKMLELIQTWNLSRLKAFHKQLGLFPENKRLAQEWRLNQMLTMASEALTHQTPLTVRDIFARLIHDHSTLADLIRLCPESALRVYNLVGRVSTEQLSSSDSDMSSTQSIVVIYGSSGYSMDLRL